MRWLVGLTLWAMLASQWVAQLHELAHYDGTPVGALTSEAKAASPTPPPNWAGYALEAGTAHDPGSALCRLIHQLAHGSVAPSLPAVAFEPLTLAAPIAVLAIGLPAAPAGAYRARAPPAFA